MIQKPFEQRVLLEALTVTSKVKEKLEPFMLEIMRGNIEWTFLIFSSLHQYLSLPETDLSLKFNALVATKIIMDTCQFTVVLIVEVYFLPLIKKIACYQISLPEKTRGIDYFVNNGYEKSGKSRKLGYNFVRLACEIINIFAIIKPYQLYQNEEVSEPSQFSAAFEAMRAQGWKEYDELAFYHQDPLKMRALYLEKLQNFQTHLVNYQAFIRSSLENIIRKDLLPIGLDPRKIVEFYQQYASNFTLELLKQFAGSAEAVAATNVLRMISEMIRWGNIGAIYAIQSQATFDIFIEMAENENAEMEVGNLGRGGYGFECILGSQQQKVVLYVQILKSLEIWAACIPKSFKDNQKDSKSTFLFKKMAFERRIKFPLVSNIKKIRNQCCQNMEKHKRLNERWLKSKLHKNQVKIPKNRRTTMQLSQLLNTQTSKFKKENFLNESFITRQKTKDNIPMRRKTNIDTPQLEIDSFAISRSSFQDQKSPFTQKFYRQKKRKGHNQYLEIRESYTRTQENNFKTSNFQEHEYPGHTKIAKLTTITSDFDSNYTGSSSQILQQQSVYSEQVEQGKVDFVIKSIEKKITRQSLFGKDKVSAPAIYKQKEQEYAETKMKKQSSNKSKVSIYVEQEQEESKSEENMEFFSSLSSKNSSFCLPESSHIHAINILPPAQAHHMQSSFKTYTALDKQNQQPMKCYNLLKNNPAKFSEFSQQKLQERVINLEQENRNLKYQLQKKEKQLAGFGNGQIDNSAIFRDEKNNKFSWTSYLFGDEQPVVEDSEKKLSQLNRMAVSKPEYIIKMQRFKSQMAQLDSLGSKKLIKTKDLLLRTQNIEIGFVFQLQKDIGKVTFYLTPEKDLADLKYKLLLKDNIKCSETSEIIQSIPKKKQRKISFNFKVTPPYLLPKLTLSYQLQGTKHSNNAIVPISYNKFVIFEQPTSPISQPLLTKKSQIEMINKKFFSNKERFCYYFNCIPCLDSSKQDQQLKSSVLIRNKPANIIFSILNEDFIQIEYQMSQKDPQIADFLDFFVMTLLAIVKK